MHEDVTWLQQWRGRDLHDDEMASVRVHYKERATKAGLQRRRGRDLHDDEVSDVEVVPAAADDQDRRDPELRVDRLHLTFAVARVRLIWSKK
eukprot:777050-Rhodomonas_salina.1